MNLKNGMEKLIEIEYKNCYNIYLDSGKDDNMETKTIQAYGYEVTGTEDIIADIEEALKDPDRKICWDKFNSKDIFFGGNGRRVYSATIDHKNKKVLAHEYEFAEWYSLKIGDRVKRTSTNMQKGNIIDIIDNVNDIEYGYVVQWDNGEIEKITDRTLSKS